MNHAHKNILAGLFDRFIQVKDLPAVLLFDFHLAEFIDRHKNFRTVGTNWSMLIISVIKKWDPIHFQGFINRIHTKPANSTLYHLFNFLLTRVSFYA